MPPPLPLVPQQFSQEQSVSGASQEVYHLHSICSDNSICSPAPHLYLPKKLPELAGCMAFGKIILIFYFNLTTLFECCYYQLLTSRAYTDLLGFAVFTPLFFLLFCGGSGSITQLVGSQLPSQGLNPSLQQQKQSPNHWTAREGPSHLTSSIT